MIGGEGTADPLWMVMGQWIEYARHYNALCFMLEHRYYGASRPTRLVQHLLIPVKVNSMSRETEQFILQYLYMTSQFSLLATQVLSQSLSEYICDLSLMCLVQN